MIVVARFHQQRALSKCPPMITCDICATPELPVYPRMNAVREPKLVQSHLHNCNHDQIQILNHGFRICKAELRCRICSSHRACLHYSRMRFQADMKGATCAVMCNETSVSLLHLGLHLVSQCSLYRRMLWSSRKSYTPEIAGTVRSICNSKSEHQDMRSPVLRATSPTLHNVLN